MKIRIKANSIRLRLSKSEVAKFGIDGYLEETTNFPGQQLIYALQKASQWDDLTADLHQTKITVFMPEGMMREWVESEKVGYSSDMRIGDTGSLHILVEKDFVCLDETLEDQSDNFENPNKSC